MAAWDVVEERPVRANADGSVSTELSITVTNPRLNRGRPTNIPSMWGGRELDEESAVTEALRSGRQFPAFNTTDDAVTAARARSSQLDRTFAAAREWDVVEQQPLAQPRKRTVGVGEAAARGAGSTFAEQGNVLALAASAPAVLLDRIASALTGRTITAAQDYVFPRTADVTRRAIERYAFDPEAEEVGTGAKVANVGGRVVAMLPSMFATAGAGAPLQATRGTLPLTRAAIEARQPAEAARIVAQTAAPGMARGAAVAQPSFAIPSTITRSQQLMEGGVDDETVAQTAIANHVMNTLMGAAPLAVPGRLATRATTGAGINTGLGAAQRGVEGEILGDEYERFAQDPFGGTETMTDAGIGAVMAALFGGRGAPPMRRPATIEGESTRVPDAEFLADFEAHRPILEANGITSPDDPRATTAVAALNQRAARRAELRVDPADMPRSDQAAILDEINAGDRHPAQTPWASREAPDDTTIVSGPRAGTAFEATPGNLAGRDAARLAPDDYATIARYTGLDEADILSLGEQSRARLLAKARQAEQADLQREPLRTSDEGGEARTSPASRPNVPGERAPFTRSEYEDTTARAQPSEADVAEINARGPTPSARRAAASKEGMLQELAAARAQLDRIVRSEAFREAKRRSDAGMLDQAGQKAYAALEAQRRRLASSIFTLESRIYDTEARSELGSKSATGTSDRPFRMRDTGEPTPEQARMFEERARTRATEEQQRVIDELEADWRAREELRQSRRQRAPKEDEPSARYRDAERSANATKQGEGGRFAVDEDGYVMSDKGAQVWFAHQRDAGWWILKTGNKESPDQTFQIANHPSGSGFTVQQTRVREAPPRGDVPPGQDVVVRAPDQQQSEQSQPDVVEPPPPSSRLDDAEIRSEVERMAREESGWIERGGHIIRDPMTGEVTGRTRWIPRSEWWRGRPDKMKASEVREAVRKALAGEPLRPKEQRTVDYMAEVAETRMLDARAEQETLDAEAAAEREAIAWESEQSARADTDFDVGFGRELTDAEAAAFWKDIGDGSDQGGAVAREGAPAEGAAGEPAVGRADERSSDPEIQSGRGEAQDPNPAQERADVPAGRQRADERSGDDFRLRGETHDEILAREQRERDERERVAREEGEAERRARADAERDDFELRGSDRPADDPRGGTLFGGLPIGPMAKAVGDALGWIAGSSKQWADSLASFRDSITDVKNRIPSPEGNPAVRFFRAVFDSASGDMRGVLRKNPSKTAEWVVDQFHTMAGADRATGETYQETVAAWTNQQLTRLHKAVGEHVRDKATLQQIANLVRNPGGIRRGTPVGDAAQAVRKLLDDVLVYLREAGVEVGEVRHGYFPREYDLGAVMKDPAGFIKGATQAYRELGMPAKDADVAAKELHDTLLYGETGSLFRADKGNVRTPFLKGRVFGKEVDRDTHPLHRFLVHDPSLVIPIYLQRAARRAEIARRFGDNFSQWDEIAKKIHDEGAPQLLEKLRDYVTLAAGLKAPGVSNFAIRGASIARTWGALMFLEKATLSSLTEFIVPAIRAGNVLEIGRSLKDTIADLVGKTEGAKERRALAEDLGIITAHLADTINAARFSGGEPVSLAESKVLDRYFRRTGLTQWTEATRVASMDIGRVFIRRLAKQMEEGGGKLAERHLAELGVPKERAAEFAKYVLSKGDGMPAAGDLAGPMGETYRAAVRRFVMQSIMQPDATLRPGWMRSPIGSIVGQLQSFNYAFWENVLKRNARLAKEAMTGADYSLMERAQLLIPTAMLPLLVGAAYVIGEGRDAILADPNRRREETDAQKGLKAFSRGMPIAPLDPFVNYVTSARYQRGAADFFAGPVLGTFGRGLDAARNVVANNSPTTNTAERQGAKAFYDIFIEPSVNLMLTATPVAPASALVTQMAGSGRLREEFVSGVAGEDKRRRRESTSTP